MFYVQTMFCIQISSLADGKPIDQPIQQSITQPASLLALPCLTVPLVTNTDMVYRIALVRGRIFFLSFFLSNPGLRTVVDLETTANYRNRFMSSLLSKSGG